MAAFWGKEVLRKPTLRGWINERNAFGLRTLNERGLLSFPVPNRASALISRMSVTDFEIDKGLIGGEGEGFLHEGGLIPGSESIDFSPLFFLPTQGDNPFSYALPGVGILPVAFLDVYMAARYDPVDEPVEYQQLQSDIGQIIPAAQYQQGGGISRVMGGGTLQKILGITTDLVGLQSHGSFYNETSQTGDIGREIGRTREISVLLADPDELAILLSATSEEEAESLLEALAQKADINAGQAHLAESVLRMMAPIGSEFSAALGEIEQVWLDSAAFPELAHLLRGDPANMTDEDRRTAANDIRTEFFALEQWERDAMVVQQPSLAVNVVGSWEWTPEAMNENVPGTTASYRTGGTKMDIAKHEALVRQGLVRLVQPIVRARRILGTIDNARRSVAKELYVTQVNIINDSLWKVGASVDPDVDDMLTIIIESDFGKRLDIRTKREAWENWSIIEEDLEQWYAKRLGIDPVKGISAKKEDVTLYDILRKSFQIEQGLKPWGDSFPGIDEENVTSKFNDWEILEIDPKSAKLAEALDINMEAGMTGEDLYGQVQQVITNQKSFMYSQVRPSYDRYIRDRSNSTGRNMMFEAAQSDDVADPYKEKIQDFLFKHELMMDRRKVDRRNGLSLADQQKMRDEFIFIQLGSKNTKIAWNLIWEEQYEKVYGALDWTPPEPVNPLNENGGLVGGASTPSIKAIYDGDTIQVQTYPGSPVLNTFRLLGIRAPELDGTDPEGAIEATEKLKDAIMQGVRDGDRIYFVRDERFGNTDQYGRILAWLWIGDTPYYNPEDLRPHQDPSGDVGDALVDNQGAASGFLGSVN